MSDARLEGRQSSAATNPIRCVVAGCGRYNNSYMLPAIAARRDFAVVGLVDPNTNRLAEARGVAGLPSNVPVFTALPEALRALGPELVFVHSNVGAHFANCRDTLTAGCHVSVAKPFVDKMAEGRNLATLAQEAGRFISVQQGARFGRGKRVKGWINDGTVGTLRYAHCAIFRDRWHNLEPYQVGEDWPVINATLIHLVDQVRDWIGASFVRTAFKGTTTPWSPYRDPAVVTGWWETADGFQLSVFQSYVAKLSTDPSHHPFEHYHLQGDRAALMWSGPWAKGPLHLLDPAERLPRQLEPGGPDTDDDTRDALLDALRDAIRNGGLVPCPADDNLHSLAAIKAAELSARRNGSVVDVAEVG